MIEGRIAPRYRVNKRATIDYGGDKYPCTVRDISSTGAALELPDSMIIVRRVKEFTLLIPEDRLRLSCRVVWQRDFRMGVTFD
ncbi:PilZ domain-containing protein [Bradyrhizobium sp. ARR65]|uniref:PilZ domain-containing protein n=1 Tax=Bradyrhizobium sp. ARR65 TaxID=1040989 RepID=UPI000463B670|nr:PilZ domain-containing protein [Bradyrhizobium sp. ARR65]